MADPHIMTTGTFEMGVDSATAVDYSAEVSTTLIKRTRDLIEIPATAATGRKEKRAGAVSNELTIYVIGDLATSSLWAELYAQLDDADGQRYFETVLKPGAVSASNPKFSGICIVTGVEVGGQWGGLASSFSLTMPIIGAITKAAA